MANAIIYTEKVLEATEEIPGRERAFFYILVKYIEYLPDTNIFFWGWMQDCFGLGVGCTS